MEQFPCVLFGVPKNTSENAPIFFFNQKHPKSIHTILVNTLSIHKLLCPFFFSAECSLQAPSESAEKSGHSKYEFFQRIC